MEKKIIKTKKITACFACGGEELKKIDISDLIDESADWLQFSSGFICRSCESISHTDGKETSYILKTQMTASIIPETKEDVEAFWPGGIEVR